MSSEPRMSPFRFFRPHRREKERNVHPQERNKSHGKKENKTEICDHLDVEFPLYEDDPASLVEALETLGETQPRVARSIPKHAKVVPHSADPLKDCLYSQQVYDDMLSDSLRVCDMLASHLDECMDSVRTKTPSSSKSSEKLSESDSGRGASSPASPPERFRISRDF